MLIKLYVGQRSTSRPLFAFTNPGIDWLISSTLFSVCHICMLNRSNFSVNFAGQPVTHGLALELLYGQKSS